MTTLMTFSCMHVCVCVQPKSQTREENIKLKSKESRMFICFYCNVLFCFLIKCSSDEVRGRGAEDSQEARLLRWMYFKGRGRESFLGELLSMQPKAFRPVTMDVLFMHVHDTVTPLHLRSGSNSVGSTSSTQVCCVTVSPEIHEWLEKKE